MYVIANTHEKKTLDMLKLPRVDVELVFKL